MRHTLKRSETIKGKKLFNFIHHHNIKVEGTFLVCYVATIPRQLYDRKRLLFGIKVQRNIKRAIDRNRIKRLVRESIRAEKERFFSFLQHVHGPTAFVFFYTSKSLMNNKIQQPKDFHDEIKKISQEISKRFLNN